MLNVSQALHKAYTTQPHKTAITLLDNRLPDQQVTCQELIDWSARAASHLEHAGILPGEVVILILPHGIELVAGFFGTILHGAVPSIMPFQTEKLSPEHYQASLRALFSITRPAAVVTYLEFVEQVRSAAQGAPSVRAILTLDIQEANEPPDWTGMPGMQQPADELVLLQHSSGTTGLQKGVALSHQAVFNQLESYSRALHLDSSDSIISWLPLYHDMGLIAGFILPILTQTPLVLMSPFDWVRAPHKLMKAVTQYRSTLCWLPNFAYNFCAQKIRARDLDGVDLSSLRAVINCSEPMYWQSHQMFLERFAPYGLQASALATCYAMAENVFAVTQGGIDHPVVVDLVDGEELLNHQYAAPPSNSTSQERVIRMLSAGRPIDGTSVRVVAADGHSQAPRRIGEIAIQSNCLLQGYYHRPDLTEKAFLNGWYLTGDLGYLANGELYITGRKKDLIIVGGKNIYPQDLERLASQVHGVHPGRVVAFGVLDEAVGTEEVVLVAEIDEYDAQSEATLEALADQIRQQVNRGSDIALRSVHLVGQNWLLKTSSGKIARSANREKYLRQAI